MRGRHSRFQIQMTDQTRTTLQSWLHRRKIPYGQAKRARALLLLEQGWTFVQTAERVGLTERNVRKWARRFLQQGISGLSEECRLGRPPLFPPEVAFHIVKLACERPDSVGRSLSQWNCPDLARQLKADGLVKDISPETVRCILQSHKLKPWRHHLWLSAKTPRDEQFAKQVQGIVDLYTRTLTNWEMVLSVDEKTNLQPRPRLAPTLPTRASSPTRLEHEYKRAGALHLFAAGCLRGQVRSTLKLRHASGRKSSFPCLPSWREKSHRPLAVSTLSWTIPASIMVRRFKPGLHVILALSVSFCQHTAPG